MRVNNVAKLVFVAMVIIALSSILIYYSETSRGVEREAESVTESAAMAVTHSTDSALEQQKKHNEAIKKIDTAWIHIREGNSFYRSGEYEKALDAFRLAYDLGEGFAGVKIVETCERLERFDDALRMIDDLESRYWTSNVGKMKADELRLRIQSSAETASAGPHPEEAR